MSSFYGGPQGRNFIISKTFKTVAEMLLAFADPNFTTVKFDEYVLIETEDKSNPENGLLFRRGYDYGNHSKDTITSWTANATIDENSTVRGPYTGENVLACGAELVGSLVGPIGKSPLMKLMTIDEAIEIGTQYEEGDTTLYDYTTGYGNYGLKYEVKEIPVENEDGTPVIGEDGLPLVNVEYDVDNENGNIVPGKYVGEDGKNVYNDEIEWYYCTVRDIHGVEGTAYLGFRFPYLVIDYDAHTVDPYYHRDDNEETITFTNRELVDRLDDMLHPYYEKWNISIPKGIKGDSLRNLRVITVTEEHRDKIKLFPVKEDGELNMHETYGDIYFEDIDYDAHMGRQIIVCDYYHYDKVAGGEPFTFYLGNFNIMGDKTEEGKAPIEFLDDGTINIRYTHDNDVSYPQEINYLTDFQIDQDGTVKIKFNNENIKDDNGHETYNIFKEKFLTHLTDYTIDEDGTITIKFNNDTINGGIILKEKFLTLLKTFTFDQETGQVQVTFNNDNIDPVDVTLNHIKKVALDPTNNHLLFYHSDPDVRSALTNKATFDGKDDWQDMGGFGYAAFSETTPDASNIAYSGLWFKLEDR